MSDDEDASQAARNLSKLGADKGGRARANVLTPEERREIAQRAGRARWAKAGKLKSIKPDEEPEKPSDSSGNAVPEMPYSMFTGSLEIGDVTFECHVLNNHQRVLTQREVVRVISGGRISGNLTRYLERNPLYNGEMLAGRTVQFRVPGAGSQAAIGYDAELLVEICELYLDARAQGVLKPSQKRLASMAETIVRACAKVGIIALVDEATGFQKVREKRALQLKLQAFIADDMQEWARMFPEEFWYELARLEGVRYSPRNRPLRWGKYVMAFVYDAIDSDVGKELRKVNPNPRHRSNHHQWLKEFGREKVNNQIQQVIAVMKLCDDMEDFRKKFARVFKGQPYQLSFFD
jgi:hypothetical protein